MVIGTDTKSKISLWVGCDTRVVKNLVHLLMLAIERDGVGGL